MDRKVLLGERIKEIRKLRGLSQDKLAERAGISAQYVSNIERGKENPTLDLLFTLTDALKVGLADLCDYESVEKMDQKRMRNTFREMLKTTEPERLRLVLRVLRALRG